MSGDDRSARAGLTPGHGRAPADPETSAPGAPVCLRCGADSHTECAAGGCPGTWSEPTDPQRSPAPSSALTPTSGGVATLSPAREPLWGPLSDRALHSSRAAWAELRRRLAASAVGAEPAKRPWATWLGALSLAAAFAFALVTRLAFLEAKPLHHDEGVNAHFLYGLVTHGRYHYDPTNYHGPFLYFFGAAPFSAFGATPLGLRLLPALAGAATLLLLIPLRRVLGWAGVACAAWLLALSPIATYVSRTAIHEAYFAFAVLAGVAVCVAYAERARSWLPSCGALAIALAYANKETAVISYGAYACGLGLALCAGRELQGWPLARVRQAWIALRATWGETRSGWSPPVPHWVVAVAYLLGVAVAYLIGIGVRLLAYRGESEARSENSFLVWDKLQGLTHPAFVIAAWIGLLLLCLYLLWGLRGELKRYWREQPATRRPWLIALAASATFTIGLFSSGFSSVQGAVGLISSLYHWVKRGVGHEKTGHEHAWSYYFLLLWRLEAPLLCLALPGALVALVRRRALELFVLGWGASTLAVYTLLSYKTPWLALNLIVPLALLAGLGVGVVGGWLGRRFRRGLFEGALALGAALLLIAPAVAPEPPRPSERWGHRWPTLVAGPPTQGPADYRAKAEPERWYLTQPWWRLQWTLNILSPDDDRYGPVYAQTDRTALALFELLKRELAHGKSLEVVAKEYWPLPAYLYPERAAYPGALGEDLSADYYLLSESQDEASSEQLRGWGSRRYQLRAGVYLVLRWRPPASEAGGQAREDGDGAGDDAGDGR